MRPSPMQLARTLLLAAALAVIAAPRAQARLDVEVWTDRGDDAVYQDGDPMRIKVRASEDAFLLVYEIDTEGHVNLLFPWKRGSGRVEGRHTLRLPPDDSDYQLVVEKETGQGFLVAIASDRPFRELPWFLRPFDPQAASVGYEGAPDGEEEGFDDQGRVLGDPYVAMERVRRRVMDDPGDTEHFASAYSTYYVHEQVRYPRYLCNDCHRPRTWAWFDGYDPYYTNCSVFDFRVNWSWYWGPHIWTSYVPYYYYVVRTDCPPRYSQWVGNRNRFSAWDGRKRWTDLWGGQLRRYKPGSAPVSYTPPPPRGMIWRKGETPPGYVPSDVRRETKTPGPRAQAWLTRDVGKGRPVWKEGARTRTEGAMRPDGGARREVSGRAGDPSRESPWRKSDGTRPAPGRGDTPAGRGREDSPPRGTPIWRPEPQRGEQERGTPAWRPEAPRERPHRDDPPRQDPPRQDPPRQEQPRQEPQRQEPVYKQAPPPRSEPPRWNPPSQGKGGKNGKG